jgi:hypothetical protein
MLRWLLPLLAFSIVGVAGAFAASASTAASSKTTPVCKAGQKSTKAKPCIKAKVAAKTTTTTKKVTTTTTTASKSSGSSSGTAAGAAAPQNVDADGCPNGTGGIPAGGDGDTDNAGGPSDGDGCV